MLRGRCNRCGKVHNVGECKLGELEIEQQESESKRHTKPFLPGRDLDIAATNALWKLINGPLYVGETHHVKAPSVKFVKKLLNSGFVKMLCLEVPNSSEYRNNEDGRLAHGGGQNKAECWELSPGYVLPKEGDLTTLPPTLLESLKRKVTFSEYCEAIAFTCGKNDTFVQMMYAAAKIGVPLLLMDEPFIGIQRDNGYYLEEGDVQNRKVSVEGIEERNRYMMKKVKKAMKQSGINGIGMCVVAGHEHFRKEQLDPRFCLDNLIEECRGKEVQPHDDWNPDDGLFYDMRLKKGK